MKSSKKGAEMSLNVVIVAAIALIVLVVLVMIFTGRMNIFGTKVQQVSDVTCTSQSDGAGRSADATTGCGSSGYKQVYGAFTDLTANQICCVPQ